MARKKGRPPKSPSSQTSSRSPSNALPKNLDLENLDEDDLEDIDALSPTKAASILQKLDALRPKIKGKAIVDDDEENVESATQAVNEVIQSQCEKGEGDTIVKETRVDNEKEEGLEVDQSIMEQKEAERRVDLWKELQEIGDSMQEKWVIMGDFNCCLNVQEKAGGIPLDVQQTEDFREMVIHCQLEDMNYSGCYYTWNNNQEGGDRILCKLDRVLVNMECCRNWPDAQTEFLNCGVSDHSPMLIKWAMFENKRSHSFKFMNHLTLDNEFLSIIQHLWRYDGEGCAMFRLMRNLERTKPGMIELNQRKYRDIDQKERLARDKLDVIQGLLHDDPMNNHLQKLEREARRDHYEW
ncbi:hypothetical protein RIF29_29136 [Crotalaria pallida]|uniref:Uncharacterized protein n=1 Tax=Crotalaria pallida TaxID=3830 RepID=A0AAN9EE69_CROPI